MRISGLPEPDIRYIPNNMISRHTTEKSLLKKLITIKNSAVCHFTLISANHSTE